MPAAMMRIAASFPTITRSRRGSRSNNARNVPPENSPAISAITVTKTRKPTNDAPTANASVPPPVPVSEARVVAALRDRNPVSRAVENTARLAITAKIAAAAIPASTV